jgi:hypothetical protein
MVRAIQLNECPHVSFLHLPRPVRLFARLIGAIRSHFVRVIVFFMNTIIVYTWASPLARISRGLQAHPDAGYLATDTHAVCPLDCAWPCAS